MMTLTRKYVILVDLLKTDYNVKTTEIEGKIPSIFGLASTAVNDVKNKIPNNSDLVKKKANYDAKISDIETKYFTTSSYNKFLTEILNKKIKENMMC